MKTLAVAVFQAVFVPVVVQGHCYSSTAFIYFPTAMTSARHPSLATLPLICLTLSPSRHPQRNRAEISTHRDAARASPEF